MAGISIDDMANAIMEGLLEYADMATEDMKVAVKKAGVNVDAITAATISSRAFLGALNDAYKAYVEMQNNGKEVSDDK